MKAPYRFSLFGPAPLAMLLAMVLYNSTGQTLVLTETHNGSTVKVVPQQSISIHLRGNASTPYSWFLIDTNGTSVVPNGQADYVSDSPGLPGSPGTFEFPFLAVLTGRSILSFAEHQYGNPQNVVASFSITIDVTNAQPILSIALVGGQVLLTWPNTTSKDFFLEGASSLQPAQWAALNALVQDDGQNFWVRLGHSGLPVFFRLHRL